MADTNPMPTEEQIDAARTPYIHAIGEVVIAWSGLQDHLAEVFARIVGTKKWSMAIAIWNSTTSDRAQREMLRAAAIVGLRRRVKARDDVLWIIDRANTLADRRNDVVHAPFRFIIDATGSGKVGEFMPIWFHGNLRALKLHGKDLMAEFKWYAQTAELLAGFSGIVGIHIANPRFRPWPDRPRLPPLSQFQNPKPTRHQTAPK